MDRADPEGSEIQVKARIRFHRVLRELDATASIVFTFTDIPPPPECWFWEDGEQITVPPDVRGRILTRTRKTGWADDHGENLGALWVYGVHYNLDMAATTPDLAGDGDLSQLAWCAQRSARWDHYLCIQTFHDGWHDYPDFMVFDLDSDPHEQTNLAAERPDLVGQGIKILKRDPLEEVMAEGGPLHVRDAGPDYLNRLRNTGRSEIAERLAKKHGTKIPT